LRSARRFALGATLAAAALSAAGCGSVGLASKNADKPKGKLLFQQKCGSCHTLADAGTQGTIGPNLDNAFSGPRLQGFKESTIQNVVYGQIQVPTTHPEGVVTVDGQEQPVQGMPANLVTGSDAQDVAAYVASVAGLPAVGASTQVTTATPPPPATTQATTTASSGGGDLVAQGKQVFQSAGCTSCHTLKDAGATGTVGPNLDEKKPPKALVVDRVTHGKNVMPSFSGQLTPAEIQAVAAYVSTVAGK
jgi:mono/diheme cytochrome c family protein